MPGEASLEPERIARKPLLGVDGDGAEHRFDRCRHTVYVVGANDAIEHVEQLRPGQLPAWVSFVADRRGWRDCRYRDADPFAALAEQLARTLEQPP